MMIGVTMLFFSVLLKSTTSNIVLRCDMIPEGVTSPRKGDLRHYKIDIPGNQETYIPGEQYTVILKNTGKNGIQNKFTHFILSVSNDKVDKYVDSESSGVGSLQLYGDSLVKFSDSCQNAVVEADPQPKVEIQVLWMAPQKGSGCVKFRATVVESVDEWFSEEGELTKILCEESVNSEDIQPKVLKYCCACDEAKYEVTFEGLWSRNTHPKDFPSNGRLTKFSDIIGASHTVNYTFWNYGDFASEGLRQLAEHGNTRLLESELKAKSDNIRTIIKARGMSYPNITGKTFAVFRVDNRHHLMSIVSRIDPSPDWIVGVSSLELCLKNCSWIESKMLNLYPWDVGTDDGITYMSPNQPSSPRQPIKRLKTSVPNDPRSPFFDSTGVSMKPLARLILSRQRLYEKSCDTLVAEDTNDDNSNCETEKWSDWSPCSATCGRGVKYKQRRYKNEESKYICHKKLTERASCEAAQRSCPQQPAREIEDPLCELGPWSTWSSCSVTCGKGVQTRDRKYKNRFAAKTCVAGKTNPPVLQQTLECWSAIKCEDSEEETIANCAHRPWSDWSPCSAICGKGFKERYRLTLDMSEKKTPNWPLFISTDGKPYEEFDEDDPCNNQKFREIVECFEKPCQEQPKQMNELACGLSKDVGSCMSNVDRWYFDAIKGNCEIFSYSGCEGNQNNFNTLEQCQTLCAKFKKELIANSTRKKELGLIVSGVLTYSIQNDAMNGKQEGYNLTIDCNISEWSNWSSCNVTEGKCGYGFKEKHRNILIYAQNGGIPCPKKLIKYRKCKKSCHDLEDYPDVTNNNEHIKLQKSNGDIEECFLSEWSPWSNCDLKCNNKYQYRFRHVIAYSKTSNTNCQNEIEKRQCANCV